MSHQARHGISWVVAAALLVTAGLTLSAQTPGTIETVAGTGTYGFSGDGGPATAAQLYNPFAVALDASGNLFIADLENHRIRRVDAASGVITTVAGDGSIGFSGDGGLATEASFRFPRGVAVDAAGNLFIADTQNNRIRRVDAVSGVITTVAGNGGQGYSGDDVLATQASLNYPYGVAVDEGGNLFISDSSNWRIRRVDAVSGIITTVAGGDYHGPESGDGGPATAWSLSYPDAVAFDAAGNLFVAEASRHSIRRVDAVSNVITTVAGTGSGGYSGDGGPATAACLYYPHGVAVDGAGNIFIADYGNNRVRRVDAASGVITTIAGTGTGGYSGDGGPASAAIVWAPSGLSFDADGNLLIAEPGGNRVRRVVDAGVPANGAPIADAGEDRVVECAGATTAVALDGSGTTDPDGDVLTYRWSGDFAGGTATGVAPTVEFTSLGLHVVTLVVGDGTVESAADTVTIDLVDTTPPVISAPPAVTVACSVEALVPVTFSVTATDVVDASPTVTTLPPSGSGFPVGVTTVTCTARDASGNQSVVTFTVTRASLAFEGFLSPIGGADATGGSYASPVRTFKLNSTIPVKFTASCGGVAVTTGVYRIQAVRYTSETTADTPIDATPTDAATAGDQFRLSGEEWHFNLDTKAAGIGTGTWRLTATLSDGSEHQVWIQIR